MKLFRAVAAVLALGVALTGLGPAAAAPQAKITTAVSLAAPSSGVYGTTIKLSGRLWRYGTTTGVNYATVQLQRTAHNKAAWATYKTAKTNADGTFAFSVVQSGAYDYRAYFTGSPVYTGALSPVRYPVTTQKVIFDTIKTTNYENGGMQATGRVFPTPPTGTTVYLQHWLASKWQTVGSGRTSSNAVTIKLTRPASYLSYRLVVATRYPYGAGISATKGFAHYQWRPSFGRPIIKTTGDGSHTFNGPFIMNVNLPPHSSEYWVHVNTSRCRLVEGGLIASTSNPTNIYVILATGRYLFSADLLPGTNVPYSADLIAQENEMTIRFSAQLGGDYRVEVRMRSLCSI
ncbi:hypothetical protein OG394_15465 [Kribbella sp. NBC_01245]|uniref:hypothetical protein n=1 Tax=Kribbella sp. NBC_01245 TaxID=2903578 RepID=UPI002E291EE4|nr:hypothetical protein [Kribbella sp. NBC_01245]